MNDKTQMRGHRADTEPRIVVQDVRMRDGHEASRVRAGTVVHALPGSDYERELGGPQNLRPVEHSDRGGATN